MSYNITNIAKYLRKKYTDAERLLWKHLRVKQLEGLKFRRQRPIKDYIVDFVCFEKGIVIEVDRGQHYENNDDKKRDEWLRGEGFKVLRFWNNELLKNINGVLKEIWSNCLNHPPLTPSREGKQAGEAPIKGGRKVSSAINSLYLPT